VHRAARSAQLGKIVQDASGHGGNRLLRERDPQHFHFKIFELVSPTMDADEVIHRENTWKERLHTRKPNGLNDN
jgi:hypothetical protein